MSQPEPLPPLVEKHVLSPGTIGGAPVSHDGAHGDYAAFTASPAMTPAANPIPNRTPTAGTAISSGAASPVDNTKRPPPFSRKVTKSLFVKPAHQRPPAPNTKVSLRNLVTHSWLNILLICNPIAWALHYTDQTPGATFAVALAGIVPLAGLLGYGTEAIAMYTGDALGGLINASLGNATEFIIAILLLVKCQIRVVQASLLGGLLSNLLLVLGMAFVVAGLRRSELEFQQTAAQLNTSLMTLAVIALIIPSAFAFALEATVGEETEKRVILQMSRGSSIILIFIYISYMVFQLYSHAHYYNPDADMGTGSASSSRSNSPSRAPTDATAAVPPTNHRSPVPPPAPSAFANNTARQNPRRHTPRRASSLPFGSAKALGSNAHGQYHNLGGSPRMGYNSRFNGSETQLRQRGRSGHGPDDVAGLHGHAQANGRDFAIPRRSGDLEGNRRATTGDESDSDEEEEEPEMNMLVALIALVAATGLTYLTAEALTDSLEQIGESGAVSPEWLGLILLAVVGNAAEHVTAVFVAYRNKVDLALAVSVGSCIQIALFVIPLLVLIGWIADKPMSLLFDPLETITLFLSVLLVRFATEDGRTHYMSGVALLGTYILIAFSFWYYPSLGVLKEELYQC